jgi:hypothetical protein
LNNGAGVRGRAGTPDLELRLRDNTMVLVNLDTARTVGDVTNAVRTATNGRVLVSIDETGDRLVVTDYGPDAGGEFAVQSVPGSSAAADLGIRAADGDDGQRDGVIHGRPEANPVFAPSILTAFQELAAFLSSWSSSTSWESNCRSSIAASAICSIGSAVLRAASTSCTMLRPILCKP